MTDTLTEEEVYSLIVTGDISRSAALPMIRAYGNRKAMDALQQARDMTPGATQSIEDQEIDRCIASCFEKLDELIKTLIETIGETN
jgi:hypothetical protein